MKNFGMIGMNQGNGHPFSFTAVFNGFDEKALEEQCDFPIIRKYLKEHHANREFITSAKVSHIWTQSPADSQRVAAVSRIPNVASSLEQLAAECDAIIFARDDMQNHFRMAKDLFKTGKPIYMDKMLCATPDELRELLDIIGDDYPLLTASSFRFAPNVAAAVDFMKSHSPMTVRGISPCIWLRYAPHLLDVLFQICGHDVLWVQNTGFDGRDIVTVTFANELQAVLQIFDGICLPMGLEFHFRTPEKAYSVPYTDDTLYSYFHSIANMMIAFADMVENGTRPVPLKDTILLNRVVLAGIESREKGGARIEMDKFMADLAR